MHNPDENSIVREVGFKEILVVLPSGILKRRSY